MTYIDKTKSCYTWSIDNDHYLCYFCFMLLTLNNRDWLNFFGCGFSLRWFLSFPLLVYKVLEVIWLVYQWEESDIYSKLIFNGKSCLLDYRMWLNSNRVEPIANFTFMSHSRLFWFSSWREYTTNSLTLIFTFCMNYWKITFLYWALSR